MHFRLMFCVPLVSTAAFSLNNKSYDLVVIGGGSAGLTAAKLAATFDKSVVIIEQNRMGGDCTWTGCIPSKSLLASAKVAHAVRHSGDFGVTCSQIKVDVRAIRNRVRANVERIYQQDDSPQAMAKLGIDTIVGKATFTSPSTLSVVSEKESITVEAKEGVVVCTGAKPKRPTEFIEGLQDVNYVTYEEIFDLDVLPKTMTVVGGGPIGCELAQAFARLGSQVTQIASVLLPNEEPEVREALEEVFAKEGVIRVKGKLTSINAVGKEGHQGTCTLKDGSTIAISGDILLVAAGRSPNVKGFGLEEIGVAFNAKGGIDTNEKLQTNIKRVYAAGDCTGDKQL